MASNLTRHEPQNRETMQMNPPTRKLVKQIESLFLAEITPEVRANRFREVVDTICAWDGTAELLLTTLSDYRLAARDRCNLEFTTRDAFARLHDAEDAADDLLGLPRIGRKEER